MKRIQKYIGGGSEEGKMWTLYQYINEKGKINSSFFAIHNRDKNSNSNMLINKMKITAGMCLECGDIDFSHLHQHHIDKQKMPDFTITLCANCHSTLHFYRGGR